MMFDVALSSSAGPPFCTVRHAHRTIAILYRKTHNYNLDVLAVYFVEFYYI